MFDYARSNMIQASEQTYNFVEETLLQIKCLEKAIRYRMFDYARSNIIQEPEQKYNTF